MKITCTGSAPSPEEANPLRYQAITASGWTFASAEPQSAQILERTTHNSRSAEVDFGRLLAERLSTPFWWRNANFSSSYGSTRAE